MKSSMPLVSVIVPFYNIRECVARCLNSLLNQTYQDYEVICIDDGSTDGTEELLDSYRGESRVVVFHKENGGLSDARNFGVKVAKGELISFVDGDDVVSPFYLEALVGGQDGVRRTMVVGRSVCLSEKDAEGGRLSWIPPQVGTSLQRRDLFIKYLYEDILPGAWSRLAPRSVYLNRPFPVGVCYEEIATAAGFLNDIENVVVLDEPIYGYVMREGSIVHRKQATFKQVEDYLMAIRKFEEEVSGVIDDEDKSRVFFRCLHCSRIFRLLDVVVDERARAEKLQDVIAKAIRSDLRVVIRDQEVSLGNKMRFLILALIPGAYVGCLDLYKQHTSNVLVD